MDGELLIYGSYGYTGALVARRAVDEGHAPTLAGRRAEPIESQATELGLDHRTFSLDHPAIVERNLADVDAVLNCAGPFSATADPLIDACLETGTDYLDIAGQVDVLEATAGRDEEARDAGIALLPAVGFDVVATDCLAAHLAEQVEEPTELVLGLDGLGTFSPGTLKSIIEGFSRPGVVREGGDLRTVPPAWKTRHVDFGRGEKHAVTVPWGDVVTAYHATGIPDIETYATVPEFAVTSLRASRWLLPLVQLSPVQEALQAAVDRFVTGPTAAQREQSVTRVWGEVTGAGGERAIARLRTPDTYDVTAWATVEATQRALEEGLESGFQAPSEAFGAEFVLGCPGVEREEGDT